MVRASWFEIPVTDLDRAVRFYESVFGVALERDTSEGEEAAYFPAGDGPVGSAGALVKGDSYVPSVDGTRVYLEILDVDAACERAIAAGGAVLFPPTEVDDTLVAEIRDSEGNRVALRADLEDPDDDEVEIVTIEFDPSGPQSLN
jgi:predicted enzyme related to lactoylglutathione lyase